MEAFDIKKSEYLVKLCILAYKEKDEIIFEDPNLHMVHFFEDTETDTQGYIAQNDKKKELIVVFRGAHNLKDYIIDMTFFPKLYPSGSKLWLRKSKVHSGFLDSYESVRVKILEKTFGNNSYEDFKITVTGHSLGGALATICSFDFAMNFNHTSPVLYTFGAPEIGNRSFYKKFNKLMNTSYRIVNDEDLIPKINIPGLQHVKQMILLKDGKIITHLNRLEKLKESLDNVWTALSGEAITDHLSRNYLASIQEISKST